MDLNEEAAAAFICAERSAEVDPAFTGRHDAELTNASGLRIGLEVTRATNRTEVETEEVIRERETPQTCSTLDFFWSIGIRPNTCISELNRQLPERLKAFEAAGRVKFSRFGDGGGMPAELDALGVESAFVADPWDPCSSGGFSASGEKRGGGLLQGVCN